MLADYEFNKSTQAETKVTAKALAFLSKKQNEEGIISKLRNSFINTDFIAIERARLILWGPVVFCFGAIAGCGYFAGQNIIIFSVILLFVGLLVLLLLLLQKRLSPLIYRTIYLIIISGLTFDFGIMAAILRAEAVKTPVLQTSNEGSYFVRGQIIDIDKSYSGNWRAKIRVEAIKGLIQPLPKYIRLSIRELDARQIGAYISCYAQIQRPPKPIVPGGYDFSRKAYFQQIGAIGFCKSKPEINDGVSANLQASISNFITSQRLKTSAALAKNSMGGGGGFLAAVFTGDRSWMTSEDTNALQIAGLHHIVSVSGMHITLIAGIVYFALLKFLALIGPIALRFDVRKISSCASMFAAFSYTIFSGAEPPAIRALIMCIVVFGAVLLNRRAISMRGLAIAAFALLLVQPENAIDAGFQMSFLATMSLVALWEFYNPSILLAGRSILRKAGIWIFGALSASFVAGLATMPIAVHNFGNISTYALAANLIATPISDFIVAPFSLLGIIFSIGNISDPFIAVAKWGLDLILAISYFFANAPLAYIKVNPLNENASFLLVFSALWLCLWKTNLRYLAAIPFLIGCIIWSNTPAPSLLIAPEGKAFLSIAQNNLKICYSKGGKFDARRLISSARLSKAETDALLSKIEYPNYANCRAGAGDYEIHYIKSADISAKKIEPKLWPVLSLTFGNKTYALDAKTAPNGAVLVRKNGYLRLIAPLNNNAPWQN